ncbi:MULTISPECIES: hypothetical protein [unclassified Candidatus Frackibacter]|uniref:hypothetical protein n=1 Tax=unclassified Candidatus Frackibacter TaxID=2648818 RepID=UPI000797E619|nr:MULTISPECIES: hypothetical protein [unclassified Candidatus Frackibacter]KXS45679.1 MAG: hypothetical protein AWU54_252 [Candidatus Frackibacter sp. T328-2]SDC66413.1 hypothetical protein SAMN04515661_11827 [Candidatus Frackibacter sp. WG11]SEM79560.1 hypothetical protein SAMN04488698_11728 [Candidatus Frackibacter sp. WG12]SFL90274.1 hypothetical protein SAMN04488699_11927 [Candidatus Frackibacter sp. WG13]
MNIILAGLIAALSAMVLNRYLVEETGNEVIIYLVPFIEETLKSFSAYFLRANLFLVHLFFGIIEAIYDIYSAEDHGLFAGLSSILDHAIFGYLTWSVYLQTNGILIGVLVATVFHTLWNYMILTRIGRN